MICLHRRMLGLSRVSTSGVPPCRLIDTLKYLTNYLGSKFMHSSHKKNKSSRADKATIFMGISHNNFPGECQSEYVRHKPAAFIRKAIKLWKFSTSVFFCFVRVPPSTAYPIYLPLPFSLSSALPPAIHLHIWTCVCRMWNTLNEHATCHKPSPLGTPLFW